MDFYKMLCRNGINSSELLEDVPATSYTEQIEMSDFFKLQYANSKNEDFKILYGYVALINDPYRELTFK